jgi:hypothetical protein
VNRALCVFPSTLCFLNLLWPCACEVCGGGVGPLLGEEKASTHSHTHTHTHTWWVLFPSRCWGFSFPEAQQVRQPVSQQASHQHKTRRHKMENAKGNTVAGWLHACLLAWLAGWLAGWQGWLATGWLAGGPARVSSRLAGWLAACLVPLFSSFLLELFHTFRA